LRLALAAFSISLDPLEPVGFGGFFLIFCCKNQAF
jgi:hypothetical protein